MNGWGRISGSTRSAIQVENYLYPIAGGHVSWATVYRLARQMEVFGIERRDVYWELARLGWRDLNNAVLEEMSKRERNAANYKPVFRLMSDGSLEPTGEMREMRS